MNNIASLGVGETVTLVVRYDVAWVLGILLLLGVMSCAFTLLEWRDALLAKWRTNDQR